MADPPPYRDTGGDTGVAPDRESTTGVSRWVKVFGIIALVLVLLVVVLLLAGGGSHGPARHTSSGDVGDPTPRSVVMESGGLGGHKPPAGGHTP
jgi:hypothetical protein